MYHVAPSPCSINNVPITCCCLNKKTKRKNYEMVIEIQTIPHGQKAEIIMFLDFVHHAVFPQKHNIMETGSVSIFIQNKGGPISVGSLRKR
jgi:hypothetical protein